MNEAKWSRLDLQDYVNRFTEHQRDNVLKQIVESELLEEVLATTKGKLILNSIVDDITNNVGNIVAISLSGDKDKFNKIEEAAHVIAISYRAMERWATMLVKGNEHKEKIKRMRK